MWAALIPVIVQFGLPLAEKLWGLWTTGAAPTQADWDALKVLGKENAKSRMLLSLINNGIDPTSPQGVALLALVA